MNSVQTIAQVLAHPVREAALRQMLDGETMTPKRCAEEIGAPLGVVAYHFRLLRQLRAVKLVSKRQVRGAIEHNYRITDLGRYAIRAADFMNAR